VERFPAKICQPDLRRDDMPKGGVLRREKDGYVAYFFRLPDGRFSKLIPERLVQTYDGVVGVDLGGWSLRKNEWRRSG
jgi:hypothetical protein